MGPLIVIAIVAIVVAAIALIAGAARRNEMGTSSAQLSRETLKKDQERRKADAAGTAAPGLSGRELEQATLTARSGAAVVPASSAAPTVWVPPDPETIGVTRRQFLNRSIVAVMGLAITTFAAAAFTAFLWPTGVGGFGSKIRVGKLADLQDEIKKNGNFLYKPEGRMWLVNYPGTALPKAEVVYAGQTALPGMEEGILALYQKCPHLGCRVPECQTSQWFECPCHGSQYNQAGEKKGGPAPRGMDRFGCEVAADGTVIVDTGDINQGPPIGVNTTGQEAQGPNCISGGE